MKLVPYPDTEELFNDFVVHGMDQLLRKHALKPIDPQELLRLLELAVVMGWYDKVTGSPRIKIVTCVHEGRLAMPCFTSLESLRAAEQEYGKHSMKATSCALYRALAKNYYPIVINPMCPHALMILPEPEIELPPGAPPDAPKNSHH